MPRKIDVYFSMPSPWTYLGHDRFQEIARRHDAEVAYRPVNLATVFAETGGLPLAQRHVARQNYRLVELQRWRERRGVPLNLAPKHWPFDAQLADRMVIAAANEDHDPAAFIGRTMKAVWAEDADVAATGALQTLADQTGLPGARIVAEAQSDPVGRQYEETTRTAMENGYFGAPTYVVDGEAFWGQDRLEFLDEMLESGRAPYGLPEAESGNQ
ncbi:MAG: 2-hydroxychromene-2-carboxylate isomerase [Hyphomicrobiales bacterium]|nr:2-hydroxychromene-2-carboxylate isomerase [Hyphomicrobiales bacterium]